MLRYLAAIGMSRMVDQKALNEWLTDILQQKPEKVCRYMAPDLKKLLLEIPYTMGPFHLILRGYMEGPGQIHIFACVPEARFGTFGTLLQYQLGLEGPDLYICGEDEAMGGMTEVMLTRTGRLLAAHPDSNGERIRLMYTGLSVEGKILLGLLRTDEDLKGYAEEEKWHQDMLQKVRSGDEAAMKELEEAADAQDREIEERLKNEDVFTVLEGAFMPADETTTSMYKVLGTILDSDKVLNPETEEWVYHLQLDIMGGPLDVYIHPDDLVGVPAKGRRFLGKVRLIGDVVPEIKRRPAAGIR